MGLEGEGERRELTQSHSDGLAGFHLPKSLTEGPHTLWLIMQASGQAGAISALADAMGIHHCSSYSPGQVCDLQGSVLLSHSRKDLSSLCVNQGLKGHLLESSSL